jgi:hypothetical protein
MSMLFNPGFYGSFLFFELGMLGIIFVHVFLSAVATQRLGKDILSIMEKHGHYLLG